MKKTIVKILLVISVMTALCVGLVQAQQPEPPDVIKPVFETK
jgi:hypothetical protein